MRQILKIIAAGVTLLLSCAVIAVIFLLVQRTSAEREIEQQLIALDQQFNTPRTPLPSNVEDQVMMPEQVGNFQRGEIDRSTDTRCTWNFQKIEWCLSTIYKKGGDTTSTIWIRIWEKSDKGVQSLQEMTGFMLCSAEMGDEIILQNEANFPYVYHLCSIPFTGKPLVYGIAWQNSDWFIGIESKYENFSEFIAAYPY